MVRELRRIAVVNRGEPAMRFLHAVRELSREQDRAISTIALYTEPDARAMFVREADEAISLGPATFLDPRDNQRKVSYLDYERLERALVEARADGVWVGWGFVAEHPDFAELCRGLGLTFIGPSPEVMRLLGDKITAKKWAEQAQVPVAPWSGGAVESVEEAMAWGERLGYPLVIKATAGGGGRGIRKVKVSTEVAEAFDSARSEALKAFGDATVFLETLVTGARHVEVQVIADHHGQAWALGVRDCTLQRRNQKVLEESPSPVLTADEDEELRQAALRLVRAVGYQNAGTVEFLYQPAEGTFAFMEVNARLQVEHPVTELVTGADLVKLQIHVAEGGCLEGEPPAPRGHAIEVRLNAEDPDNGFAPAPGAVELLRLPCGPGIRVDTGVAEGDVVPQEFDSMIAKVLAYGRDREEALSRLGRALLSGALVLRGGTTNKGFLLELLRRREVRDSEVDIGWLDRLVAEGKHRSQRLAEIALVQAAIEAYGAEIQLEKKEFYTSAARGRPGVRDEIGRVVELEIGGNAYEVSVRRLGERTYRLCVDGCHLEVTVETTGPWERRLGLCGRHYRVLSVAHGPGHLVEVEGVPHRVSREQGGLVRAPAPAVVVAIAVEEGQRVEVGDRLAVLEAMKMEMPVLARFAGTVRQVLVTHNVQVAAGAPLMRLEPEAGAQVAASAERLAFEPFSLEAATAQESVLSRCQRNLGELRRLMLGYDVDDADLERAMAERAVLCREAPAGDESIWQAEDEILTIFSDVCSLFDRQPDTEDQGDGGRRSSEQYLFSFLRDPGAGVEDLPAGFVRKLERAVAHYGVESLEPSPRLEHCLFRLYRAYRRAEDQVTPVLSVLERRLELAGDRLPLAAEGFRALLDRLISETLGRYLAVHDAAREVRFRFFELPVWEQARQRVYAAAQVHLDALEAAGDEAERRRQIDALVRFPQPLKTFLSAQFDSVRAEVRPLLVEILTRRYYRTRQLEDLETEEFEGHCFAAASYADGEERVRLLSTHTEEGILPQAVAAMARRAAKVPGEGSVVTDFYVWGRELSPDPSDVLSRLCELFDQAGYDPRVSRVGLVLSAPGGGLGFSPARHFTFRPTAEGFREDRLYRGFHPMMAERLQLWRLRNFDIERLLPSEEHVFLFRGVARDNSNDERLFALVEIRDLTPVKDESGRVVELPHLEHMFLGALAGLRRFQARRPPKKRLHWNRVMITIWPPLDLRLEELQELVNRLAPETLGLGLQKVVVRASMVVPGSGEVRDTVLDIVNPTGRGALVRFRRPTDDPIKPLSEYARKVVRLRQRGMLYPYELLKILAPARNRTQSAFPPGDFQEYDLDGEGQLVAVNRPYGRNTANVIVGVVRNFTRKVPEGMARVILLGDASEGMGALAEPECRRILGAIRLAESLRVPLEWFALSAGAKIAMDSGTENMDWIARVLRRLVRFTQDGGEVNIVVDGINVGAQPYWNAEATMLMHTRGILVMTPDGAMVLTGKTALDYSGGVSAEDNQGIGGYERIMGPNGQAQYFARDINDACRILLRYYEHSYVVPGERFPRRAETRDSVERDIRDFPHGLVGFDRVGEIFSTETNPGRKKPFDIRRVMTAVVDQDLGHLERWFGMRDAEIAVVWDAHLGGNPVTLLGLESRPLPRLGLIPADGPDQWTAGTLFPQSSKKIARALNAASGNRPAVILANLSGFDGSPESMRQLQLEFGAEIGRAVVNFRGPIIFCVISRYHGGAFVVFSAALNDLMEVAALEGSHASVIGGAPAAAVVFAREVQSRAGADPRVVELEEELARAAGADRVRLEARLREVFKSVHSEKLGEKAEEFDREHSIYRAQRVGSVHHILKAERLRPYLVEAVERGMQRTLEGLG